MKKEKEEKKRGVFSGRYSREFIEVACPVCKRSKIICLPEESIPQCEICHKDMVLKEVLTEGKY